ncbi:hypothetical protein ES705_43458 [subsurface metagenome]
MERESRLSITAVSSPERSSDHESSGFRSFADPLSRAERTPEVAAVSGICGEGGESLKTLSDFPRTNLNQSVSETVLHTCRRLPSGHRFFPDIEREINARAIDWAMSRQGVSALFTTLTFKDEVSPRRAQKMAKRWLAKAQQSLNDTGGRQLKSFCATEWQKRQVIHFHLLLIGNGLDALSRKRLEHRWEATGGGYARCYDADRQAAPYLAKYTSKTLGGDVEWGGTWRGLRYPASVSRQQAGAPTLPG